MCGKEKKVKNNGVQAQTEKIQVGIPSMGVYGPFLKKSFQKALEKIGIKHVKINLAPPITRKTINLGTQHMDENVCLPAKIILGNILDLFEKGIKIVLEWDNCGSCRQKAYGLLHESILRQLEIDAKILVAQPSNPTKWLGEIVPDLSWRQRRGFIREVLRELWEFDLQFMKKQANFSNDGRPKIGACGEIYTLLEPASNFNLFEKLKKQGANVHNAEPLSQFMFKRLLEGKDRLRWAMKLLYLGMFPEIMKWCVGRMKRPDVDYALLAKAKQHAEKYCPKESVGGHGKDSIVWTIYYALAGYDGVVHLMPFPCMPEATVTKIIDEVSKNFEISVSRLVFDQQFGEQNIDTRVKAIVEMLRFKKEGLAKILSVKREGFWIGLDVGSTSTKAVLLNGMTYEIVDREYQFTNRDPISAIKRVVTAIIERNPDKKIVGGATTGSGRELARAMVGGSLAVDEISCQAIGGMFVNPNVCSIMEIGGQDSKYILLKNGVPEWFNMNSICTAGTGNFLASLASTMKIAIEKLGAYARMSTKNLIITGRCVVFAESDVVSKQQQGYSNSDIVRGVCRAFAKNYLNGVCKTEKPMGPIMFTGAVALNEGVLDALEEFTGQKILVHPEPRVSGAMGAALIALATNSLGGFKECKAGTQFGSDTFNCKDCSNSCEVSLIQRDEETVCALGSACGKHEKLIGLKVNKN